MSYYLNVPYVPYKFGNEDTFTLFQNVSQYVDLVDQLRDNNSFYQKYVIIDGERPDTLSFKLYGSTKYYWSFFLMNQKLREQGWPLTRSELDKLVEKNENDTVLTTLDDLTTKFKVGSEITGSTSDATGTIISRNLNLGQIVVKDEQEFFSGENVTTMEDNVQNVIQITSSVVAYDSIFEYRNVDGEAVDINPYNGPGAQLLPVTVREKYIEENDNLKDIVVLKPDVISAVYEQFQEAQLNART